jgi:tyrosinase
MSRISRRSFVAGMAALPAGMLLKDDIFAMQGPARVRYEARTPQGKAMLKIYARAVENMKKLDTTKKGDPSSWLYQWYTHAVPPNGEPGDKAAAIASTYPSPSPHKTLAEAMWNTCQPHIPPTGVSDYFLPWHRMFVYWFERIIRVMATDDAFTLPYWNYSAGTDSARMPEEFRSGVLLVSNRNPGVNTGNPIDSNTRLSALPSLSESCYSQQSSVVQGFCMRLNRGLHGTVHVDVGTGTNMGYVPTAGQDPIFWMHHCNIDRLWASWNAFGGKNPASGSAWGLHPFTFAKPDGTKVVMKNNEVTEISPLGYSYDHLEPKPADWKPCPTRLLTAAQATTFASVAQTVSLEKGTARVSLARAPLLKKRKMTDEIQRLGEQKSLYLVLKNLETNVQPGVVYDLYLDLPENGQTGETTPNYVGSINFFGSHKGHGTNDAEGFYSFNVTDVARKLQAGGGLTEEPTVTIAPAGKPASDAKPVVGQVSLVEK